LPFKNTIYIIVFFCKFLIFLLNALRIVFIQCLEKGDATKRREKGDAARKGGRKKGDASLLLGKRGRIRYISSSGNVLHRPNSALAE